MKLIHRGKKGSSALSQARDQRIAAAADGGAGSNCRQVAPDDTPLGTNCYGSSRDEAFFEASPWLDSDCEDDFFSVNGDATPSRTFSASANNKATPFGPHKLPTLEAILKAEPLKPPPAQMKLADLLQEQQEGGVHTASDGLSRAGSSRAGEEASQCCIPHLARAISCRERRKHK